MRRFNAMSHVAPKFSSMVVDPLLFSSREHRYLFGEKFITALDKEAEMDSKMDNNIGRYGGHSSSRKGNYSHRKGNHQGGGSRTNNNFNNSSKGGANWNRGKQQPQQQKGKQQQGSYHNNKYVDFSSPVSVTDDQWILQIIESGYHIEFTHPPVQDKWPSKILLDEEKSTICNTEIKALSRKGAIVVAPDNSGFISNFFIVPKNTKGKFRPIFNLKNLNLFVSYEHFKMEGTDKLKYLIRNNDYLVKLDLQNAYFLVPVVKEHQKFFKFFWKGIIYQYVWSVCLPFGLSSAPRVFTKVMKPLIARLRALGIRLIIYLDDILIMGSSHDEASRHLKVTIDLLQSVGFLISWEKSVLFPAQTIEFLGLNIDSRISTISLPPAKVDSIIALCYSLLRADQVKLRDIAKILGNFSWSIPTVPFAQGHSRLLQQFYIWSMHYSRDLSQLVTLSPEACLDLQWWVDHLRQSNGKAILPSCPDLSIFADASLQGWGAVCGSVTTRGPCPQVDRSRHINELELLGALYAWQTFTRESRSISVHLFLDNSTAVAYVNKCGGTCSRELSAITSKIVKWCESRNISPGIALMAFAALVAAAVGNGNRHSACLPVSSSATAFERFAPTSALAVGQVSLVRLDVIRRRFQERGFSPQVIELLLASSRSSTANAFQSAWSAWIRWNVARGFDNSLTL
ncbi:Uncharacterized protein APZ42_032360 [Daphnia magna]|uniref:Reverse transcriptase domain-containing protein n=1 Tax=Daphnia magna TaxID=35525 RepID=A0A164M267_9CRUS|nr:Uncharacterized protein APZ42_032360 [Daphnia magna]